MVQTLTNNLHIRLFLTTVLQIGRETEACKMIRLFSHLSLILVEGWKWKVNGAMAVLHGLLSLTLSLSFIKTLEHSHMRQGI
jgi:hypothetical protein